MRNQKEHQAVVATVQRESSAAHRQRLLFAMLFGLLFLVVCAATSQAQEDMGKGRAQQWDGYEFQPLRINIWHDKGDDEIYRNDEPVRVHFDTNQDAYVVVYRIDADGEVTILWPHSRFDDGFVFGSHTYNLPAPGARRIKAAGQDGVEYVQAVVSAYPFDLRHLDVDFHHEPTDIMYAYYVAGDPFLAMNEVNYAVTGLEDSEDFVATNYISYYVGSRVDHPRYLCSQCHDVDVNYHPYKDHCTVEIHHDYGWGNDWYGRYGYFPVYYNPVYYYVDPWTARPWINYWYRPWYSWPSSRGYAWNYDFYVWNYSPYWQGNVSTYYGSDNRRFRPISKDVRYKNTTEEIRYKNPEGMVKSARPTSKMVNEMSSRTVFSKVKARETPAATTYRNTNREIYRPERAIKRSDTSPSDRPGIRLDRKTVSGQAARRPAAGTLRTKGSSGRSGETGIRSDRDKTPGTSVKPVTPRNKGARIWSGGRSTTRSTPEGVKNSQTRTQTPNKPVNIKPTPKTKPSTQKTSKPTVKSKTKSSGSSESGKSPKGTTTNRSSGSGKTSKSTGGKSKTSR